MVQTLDEWLTHAAPKNRVLWQDARSAKEAARAWLEVTSPALPPEIDALLRGHAAFGPVIEWTAEPAVRTRFDTFAWEPHSTDVLVSARDSFGRYVIAVEAKGDEPFGETVGEALSTGLERKLTHPNSNEIARIEQLASAVLGPGERADPPLATLRYQLLTAVATALRIGIDLKTDRVLLLIQEFITRRTRVDSRERNAKDLSAFVRRLSHGAINALPSAQIKGPFVVQGHPLFNHSPHLYIAQVSRDLRYLAFD